MFNLFTLCAEGKSALRFCVLELFTIYIYGNFSFFIFRCFWHFYSLTFHMWRKIFSYQMFWCSGFKPSLWREFFRWVSWKQCRVDVPHMTVQNNSSTIHYLRYRHYLLLYDKHEKELIVALHRHRVLSLPEKVNITCWTANYGSLLIH